MSRRRHPADEAISAALAECDVLARVLNEHCVAPLREHLLAARHAVASAGHARAAQPATSTPPSTASAGR